MLSPFLVPHPAFWFLSSAWDHPLPQPAIPKWYRNVANHPAAQRGQSTQVRLPCRSEDPVWNPMAEAFWYNILYKSGRNGLKNLVAFEMQCEKCPNYIQH